MQFINIIDFEEGKGVGLIPSVKQAVEIDVGQPSEQVRAESRNFAAELKKMAEGSDEPLGEREIDGRITQGFRVTKHAQVMEMWVDPETGYPVLIEAELPGGMSYTMSDFVLNPELDDSLFDLTIPDDYKKVRPPDMSMEGVTEQDLIEGLRFFAEVYDNTFPSDPQMIAVSSPDFLKRMQKHLRKQFEGKKPSEEEGMEWSAKLGKKVVRFRIFIQLNAGYTWVYAGKGVALGDASTPVCWYRPKDSETYRVVYGDLSVQDVAEKDLPQQAPETAPAAK